ncbi:MAG: hypothetical protein IAE82_08235 [Opitutaceae bacterium]|nr:hypothetical protein [Opitutaceae bacterium]
MKTRMLPPWRALLPAAATVASALLLTGCIYDAPLETRHTTPVDPAVLGVWEAVDPDDDGPETMVILRFSETEYLVHYPTKPADSMYFRAYAITEAGVPCVQVELLGSHDGLPTGTGRYQVVSYRLVAGQLEIRTLNDSLVSSELSGRAALREAFKKHARDPDLFTNPGTFKRVGE